VRPLACEQLRSDLVDPRIDRVPVAPVAGRKPRAGLGRARRALATAARAATGRSCPQTAPRTSARPPRPPARRSATPLRLHAACAPWVLPHAEHRVGHGSDLGGMFADEVAHRLDRTSHADCRADKNRVVFVEAVMSETSQTRTSAPRAARTCPAASAISAVEPHRLAYATKNLRFIMRPSDINTREAEGVTGRSNGRRASTSEALGDSSSLRRRLELREMRR